MPFKVDTTLYIVFLMVRDKRLSLEMNSVDECCLLGRDHLLDPRSVSYRTRYSMSS
jgi:hypothetical protein